MGCSYLRRYNYLICEITSRVLQRRPDDAAPNMIHRNCHDLSVLSLQNLFQKMTSQITKNQDLRQERNKQLGKSTFMILDCKFEEKSYMIQTNLQFVFHFNIDG